MLGIIGGSGLYDVPELSVHYRKSVQTPYGLPSDDLVVGDVRDVPVVFLARHGVGHRLTPTELPYQANVYAMKLLGVTHLLTISAVGSLREQLPPLSIVQTDQIIDRTVIRPRSFFGEGVVAHVGIAEPYCRSFGRQVSDAANRAGHHVVDGGTYVCIEGPQFSTRAESQLFRSWGCDVIGMTAMPEARLAREAELCYSTLAMVTDFDVWHETVGPVDVAMVSRYLSQNAETGRQIVAELIGTWRPPDEPCDCHSALSGAIVTDPATISREARARLGIIADRYLPPETGA